MRRLLKFLFGCAIGASAALLVTPKRGSEMREKLFSPQMRELVSGRVGELMKPREAPGDELAGAYDTVVEEPPVEVEEPPVEVAEVEEPPVAETDEDLKAHIEATKAALVTEIEQPFEEPVVEAPIVEESVVEEPVAEAPVVEAPIVEEPVVEEPVVEEPVVEEPVVEEPVVEEPVVEEPLVEEPLVEEPLVEEPLVEEPVVEEPVVEEPIFEAPVVEEPVVEEPVVEEPVVEEPVFEEPVVEEPVYEKPIFEAPVVEEPVAEAPVVEEPLTVETTEEPEATVQEPVAIDQAEMRRRIEETRARLKAKAFDAMMSGEAALLARDSSDESLTKEPEIEVDGDVANTIDESLSQEEY